MRAPACPAGSSRAQSRPRARARTPCSATIAQERVHTLKSLQALPATVLGALGALGSEFLREWEAQDMRVTLFKLLLFWLVLSLLSIQLAWGFYGSTVTGLYHRPGLGGQNGSTPDGSTHFPSWETAANEPLKTHRE